MGEGGTGDTGGTTEPDDNTGWQPDDSNTLWGWLTNIVGGLGAVIENIAKIPQSIIDGLKGFFENVVNAIKELPTTIINGIKGIFIPDTDYIDNAFNSFIDEMKMKFNFDTEFFESLFQSEKPVEDVYLDYSIPGVGDFKLKVLDTKFLVDGVTYFRPFIRGFLVLLMFLYHVRQLIGFFGYDAGVVAGRSEWITYNKANTGGHKDE